MSLNLADYQNEAREAVKAFWGNREAARRKQIESGKADQGERSGVTGGKNMDGFLALVRNIVRLNDLVDAAIYVERRALTLPGYFRPTQQWDVLVINDGKLIAAIEFKSQVGPSFGNNFNNRAVEAIGLAVDLWKAYREQAFGKIQRPFVGWLMLVEDCTGSRSPVRGSAPHFPVFREFDGTSYADRYDILCQRLVQEQLYTAASVLLSPRTSSTTGVYSEMSEMTDLTTFVTTLAGHVAAEAARTR